MRGIGVAPALGRRPGWIVIGILVVLLAVPAARAQQPPAPAAQAQQVSNARLFANDGGLVLNFIKPDKTADFEMVIGKVREALQKSDKPERKQQAASWKVFHAAEKAGANELYVFVIDPPVKGADYQISNIIAEGFPPAEANEILKKYADCYTPPNMNVLNLNAVK